MDRSQVFSEVDPIVHSFISYSYGSSIQVETDFHLLRVGSIEILSESQVNARNARMLPYTYISCFPKILICSFSFLLLSFYERVKDFLMKLIPSHCLNS